MRLRNMTIVKSRIIKCKRIFYKNFKLDRKILWPYSRLGFTKIKFVGLTPVLRKRQRPATTRGEGG